MGLSEFFIFFFIFFLFIFFYFLFFRRQGFRMITFDRQAGPLQNFNRSHVMVIRKKCFPTPCDPRVGAWGVFCVLRPQEHFLAKNLFQLNIPPPPPPPPPPARPRPVFRTLTPILVQ